MADIPKTQIDPMKIIAPLREKLSSSQLQEAILTAMLNDANTELMQLRNLLQEREEMLASYTNDKKEQGDENDDAS